MSYELMRAVIEQSELRGPARMVAVVMAFYARVGQDVVYASNGTVTTDWGMSLSTLQRGLRGAEQAGVLQRQPQHESRVTPRVYRVLPAFRRQLSILDPGGERPLGEGCQPASDTPPGVSWDPSCRARPRMEGKEGIKTPPDPPLEGGSTGSGDPESFILSSPTPRPQGAAVARRRRRRRRAEQASSPPEPCPLDSAAKDPAVVESGEEAWLELNARLERELAAAQWEKWRVWTSTAHVHGAGEALEVGVESAGVAAFVVGRFGGMLERLGVRVVFVSCERAKVRARS